MEKYGVQLDKELVKKGSAGSTRCAVCGSTLTDSNPPICPNCGSLPEEPKDPKESK